MLSSRLFQRVLLPVAAIVLLGLVVVRERREPAAAGGTVERVSAAPLFELSDQNNKPVRLKSYLGRTRLVVVFYNGERGADRDPLLRPLLDHIPLLDSVGIELFAISLATPYANREAEKRMQQAAGCSLLTDIDLRDPAPAPAHRAWGRYDTDRTQPLTGLFLVDRRGYVAVGDDGFPRPEADPQRCIERLIRGEWPGN